MPFQPAYPGQFPSLGPLLAAWIEHLLVVPGGPLMGQPFALTPEQERFLGWHYRLDLAGRWVYRASQLVRSQKWGKDPLAAAMVAAEALGPVLFDGWATGDEDEEPYELLGFKHVYEPGEPMGRPWAAPWIQIAAVSEDQTANTFRPLYVSLSEGPLSELPGLDIGETRVNLPGYGRVEPVTSNARSRLGQPIHFAVLGETQLWTKTSGGHDLFANMRRNLAGMSGRSVEVSNAYDPSEDSVAQRTHTGRARDIYLDWRPAPDPTVSLENKGELRRALRHCYGDSHWVDLDRIVAEIQDPATSPADARRFFLTLIVVGDTDLVDPIAWDAAARPDEKLAAGTPVALGFDGSKSDDCTSLVACRIADGRLFHLRTWERPDRGDGWRVPGADVDQVMSDTFAAYDVWYCYADPWRWQDYLDRWAGRWPGKIVELPTNNEGRVDAALGRFLTAFRAGQLTHDGDPVLSRHVKDTAVARGKRKAPRDPDTAADPTGLAGSYLRPVKKKRTVKIDAAVAALLAYEARGRAVEDGALSLPPPKVPHLW